MSFAQSGTGGGFGLRRELGRPLPFGSPHLHVVSHACTHADLHALIQTYIRALHTYTHIRGVRNGLEVSPSLNDGKTVVRSLVEASRLIWVFGGIEVDNLQ